MYHAIVKHRILSIFKGLSEGKYEPAVQSMADRFEHIFAGDHALGGCRHSKQAMQSWFERLFRLTSNLRFTIKHIAVAGYPWDTTVIVEWHDAATLANGKSYDNDGVHIIRMRWGKATSVHAYLDTAIFATACRTMASQGIAEAVAGPIED